MQNITGTPIPWPDRAQFSRSPILADELDRITSGKFIADDQNLASGMTLLAKTNGLELSEAMDFTHNATVVALQQLAEASLSKVKPAILAPTLFASISRANLTAIQHPMQLIPYEELNGSKHVGSILDAKTYYLNVRNQDYSIIEDEAEFIQSLGLGGQVFQPFAWLFVERENSMDVLHRYHNPFETTLFSDVREALRSTVPGGVSLPKQGFLSRFDIGGKR